MPQSQAFDRGNFRERPGGAEYSTIADPMSATRMNWDRIAPASWGDSESLQMCVRSNLGSRNATPTAFRFARRSALQEEVAREMISVF